MKTKLLKTIFLCICCQLIFSFSAKATSVDFYYFFLADSSSVGYCPNDSLPLNGFGYLTGYSSSSEVVSIYVDFGDGTDTTYTQMVTASDSWRVWVYLNHAYTSGGTYTPTLTVTVLSDGTNSTLALSSHIFVNASCFLISGTVFRDCDLDCTYDVGEEFPSGYFHLSSSSANYLVFSDPSGHYSKQVVTDVYSLESSSTICNPSGVVISGISSTSVIDVPFNCSLGNSYNAIGLTNSPTCVGDTAKFQASFYLYDSLIYHRGDIVIITINYGDGTIYSFTDTLESNFSGLRVINDFEHVYLSTGSFLPSIIYTMPDSRISVANLYAPLYIASSCDVVSGYLYNDANSNCIKDVGEMPLNEKMIHFSSGSISYYCFTDINGFYSIRVPIGLTYTMETYSAGDYLLPSCPASGSATFTLTAALTQDFAYECSGFNAGVYFFNTYPRSYVRSGEDTYGRIGYSVGSCAPISGTVSMTLDPLTTFVFSSPAPTSISGSTISWDYASLSASDGMQFIEVTFHTSSSATSSDIVCLDFDISPLVGDVYTPNNHEHLCVPVGSSWDPNYKEVSPQGAGPEGIIAPGTDLRYTVHFQNTGNSFARNIFVIDTLDEDLDLNTLKILDASHAMKVFWLSNRIIKFSFENIMLVDSGTSQELSQGYFSYSIKHNAAAPLGTELTNTAAIYFDFNAPVITNTTHNKLGLTDGISSTEYKTNSMEVFPNPASDFVQIKSMNAKATEYSIVNMLGNTIMDGKLHSNLEKLDISALAVGYYMINIKTADHMLLETKKICVVR